MRRPVFALACILAALSLVPALVAPAHAQSSSELAPTWEQQVARSTSELRQEEAKLSEAEADLREAEQDGSSYSFIDSRQERVDYYTQSAAVARARVEAAKEAQDKQTELDAAGEPQGDAHELKEVVTYFEAVESGAQAAGDEAAADEAREELEGGVLGAGLRERLEIAEAEQAARQASQRAFEETTQAAEPTRSTEATTAPPPAGGDGGQGDRVQPEPAPAPEPAPEPAPPEASGPAPNAATLVVLALFALGAAAYLLPRLPGVAPVASRLRAALANGMASHHNRKKASGVPPTDPTPVPEPAAQAGATSPRPEGDRAPEPGEAPESSSGPEGPPASDLDDVFGFDADDAGAPDDADDPTDAGASPEDDGR